jgi:hypothetical protein
MSKRQKRRSHKGTRPAINPLGATANQPIAATSQPAAPNWNPQRGFVASEFKPDYSAVKKDLKRIGLLAMSFFVILIVLSFFLR